MIVSIASSTLYVRLNLLSFIAYGVCVLYIHIPRVSHYVAPLSWESQRFGETCDKNPCNTPLERLRHPLRAILCPGREKRPHIHLSSPDIQVVENQTMEIPCRPSQTDRPARTRGTLPMILSSPSVGDDDGSWSTQAITSANADVVLVHCLRSQKERT